MWYHASQTQYIEYQWFQIGVFVSITLQEYIGVWNLLDQTWDAVLFKWIMRRIRTHTFKQVQWVLAKTSASFGRFSTPLARWCFEISSHFHFYLGNYPIWLVLFKRVETINYMFGDWWYTHRSSLVFFRLMGWVGFFAFICFKHQGDCIVDGRNTPTPGMYKTQPIVKIVGTTNYPFIDAGFLPSIVDFVYQVPLWAHSFIAFILPQQKNRFVFPSPSCLRDKLHIGNILIQRNCWNKKYFKPNHAKSTPTHPHTHTHMFC